MSDTACARTVGQFTEVNHKIAVRIAAEIDDRIGCGTVRVLCGGGWLAGDPSGVTR